MLRFKVLGRGVQRLSYKAHNVQPVATGNMEKRIFGAQMAWHRPCNREVIND